MSIRTLADDKKAQADIHDWAIEAVLPELINAIYHHADRLAHDYETTHELATLHLAKHLEIATKALTQWQAGEARATGATHQDLADAGRYASSGAVKRVWPHLDTIAEARKTANQTRKPQHVEIDEYTITLNPQ